MNENILVKGLLDNDLNLAILDGEKCKRCKKVPEVKPYMARSTRGKLTRRIDRSSRIDCDASVGNEPPRYETFCRICWIKEVFND